MLRIGRRRLKQVATGGVLAAIVFSSLLVGHRPVNPASAASSLAFGPTTVVDDQRSAGEPSIKVCGPDHANGSYSTWSYSSCGGDNPYISVPWGFSTTTSYIWRSEDKANTFKLVPSNSTTGKPDACPGGGDTDIGANPGTTQSMDFINFEDLQGLTNFSAGVSRNGGQTWSCNPVSADATAVDRQWFGFEDNPAFAPANHSRVYLDYDIVAGVPVDCPPGPQVGNEFVVQVSTDGGKTFAPFVPADCNDGIAGNIAVDEANDHVFAIHTAYSSASAPTADAVTVNESTDHGSTWTRHVVFACSATAECTTGQDFAVIAIDRSGGLYAVWSQAPVDNNGNITGSSHIYYSYSGNQAATWTPERQVDTGSTDVNLFPWVAAANAGKIDVVWYGTTKSGAAASWDPGSQTTDWYPYMTQSLNANTSSPTFNAPIQVAQHANHNGGICTMGIGCTTGGDRSLLDFFQVTINKEGGADVAWADTSNNANSGANQGALIDEARQISGPTLYGTSLFGTAPTCTAVTSTPCQVDRAGDATYEANGIIGPNVPKLDITGSSVNIDPADHTKLDVRLQLASLSSLPKLSTDTGINAHDAFIDYLTSWNYHVPGNTQANYDSTGNIYYAYLEVNATTGAVNAAYDGNTCSIATTHPKYLVYPGQNAITYAITYGAPGTIDLYVPLADVGNPPSGANLYSVTAHTVGQPLAAGPYTCSTRDPNGNNQDPSGQIFDVYDKSPAYTSQLVTP